MTSALMTIGELFPAFAAELMDLTESVGRPDLAAQVGALPVLARCTCGEEYCAFFHTAHPPLKRYPPGHSTLALPAPSGLVILDIVNERIVAVEVLYRSDVKSILDQHIPLLPYPGRVFGVSTTAMNDFDYFLDRETLEILARGDHDESGQRIVALLAKEDTAREVRNTLVFCVDRRVTDFRVRVSLSLALYKVARDLVASNDEAEREVAKTAIGKATTLLVQMGDFAKLSELMKFLGPRNPDGVRQAALRAISNGAFDGVLPALPELHDLRRAVTATADDLCRADRLGTWGVAPMAIAAVVAARALGLPIETWLSEFRSRPLLLKQLNGSLEDLMEWWSATG